MKVIVGSFKKVKELCSIATGECCRFVNNLHQKHNVNDVFIRASACCGYTPERIQDKLPVVNTRTGELAYADPYRKVYSMSATLCLDE